MAPPSVQPPRPAPRSVVTTSLRHDDDKLKGRPPSRPDKTWQESAPLYRRNRIDDAHQRSEGAGRSEAPTVDYSAYAVKCETDQQMGDIKKRPIPPCPCPDDIKPRFRSQHRGVDFMTPAGAGEGMYGMPLDVKDQKGYCRLMKAKLNELYRTAGPMQHNLRSRILAEKTWFELQSKLFLQPPVTTQRTFVDVLHRFEKKRFTMARKERNIWKQVGEIFVSHTLKTLPVCRLHNI